MEYENETELPSADEKPDTVAPSAPTPAADNEEIYTGLDTKDLAAAVAADNTVAVVQGDTGVVTTIDGAIANPSAAPGVDEISAADLDDAATGPEALPLPTGASTAELKESMLYRLDYVLHAFEHRSVTIARDLVHAIREDLAGL